MLKNLKKDIKSLGRDWMLKSNRFPIFFALNKKSYDIFEQIIKKHLSVIPNVTSVYISHGLALGELYPGLSDFDLNIVFEPAEKGLPHPLLIKTWRHLRKFLPVRDIILFARLDFQNWQKYGGGIEPLDDLVHWKLMYGEELRSYSFDLDNPYANRDRLRHALVNYHKLNYSAIKEEPSSAYPLFSIFARREFYKSFCSAILSLDQKYFTVRNQFERLSKWVDNNSKYNRIPELIKMHNSKFFAGPITILKSSLTADAYLIIDEFSKKSNPSYIPVLSLNNELKKTIPPTNFTEVKEQLKPLINTIIEILGQKIESIVLDSNGSSRGYRLFIVLKSNLSVQTVEKIFIQLRMLFRIHDDPWFNEHFPDKVPIVYSKNMFELHLKVWPLSNIFGHYHRSILFGYDLYKKSEEISAKNKSNWDREFLCESINMIRYYYQTYLEKQKVALYDAVTIHFPRLYVRQKTGRIVSTDKEAVFYYNKIRDPQDPNFPQQFIQRFGITCLDELNSTMGHNEFKKVLPFLIRFTQNMISLNTNQ